MTVALLGVGADTTNASPTPPVGPGGRFEYVPIPEAEGPDGTTESTTYGTAQLAHRDACMADSLDHITPRPSEGRRFTGDALADWPLHHDPNFAALTYGETESRAAYTNVLRRLDPGDVVAFYTGLRPVDADGEPRTDSYRHRYLIGHFTVARVLDLRAVAQEDVPAADGDRATDDHPAIDDHDARADRNDHDVANPRPFSDLPLPVRQRLVASNRENAHVKRYLASAATPGERAFPAGDGLVIVDGREPAGTDHRPGGLLERAVRISEHRAGGHHYLTDELQAALDPAPGGNPDRNAHLGGVKPAHACRVEAEAFRELVADRIATKVADSADADPL